MFGASHLSIHASRVKVTKHGFQNLQRNMDIINYGLPTVNHSIITVGYRKNDATICQHYGSQFAPSPDFHSSDLFPHCKLHLRAHSLCTHFGLGRTHNIFYPSPVQVLSKVLGTMNTDTTEDLGAVKEIIHHKTIRGKSTKKNTRSTRPGKLHF